MKFKRFLQDYYVVIAIILAIIVTTALSFADLIPSDNALRYLLCADIGLAITLFIVSLKNDKKIDDLKSHIEGCSSKKVNRKKHYQLLTAATVKAEIGLKLMTIDQALNRNNISAIPERALYYKTIEAIATTRHEISIERIYGLPTNTALRNDRIEWIRSDLMKFKKCPNYHMYIFDWKKFDSIPTPLSLQIVDDSFAGLVNMQHPESGIVGGNEDICIEDTNVVQHLQMYFETIREKCGVLKVGNSIDESVLQ